MLNVEFERFLSLPTFLNFSHHFFGSLLLIKILKAFNEIALVQSLFYFVETQGSKNASYFCNALHYNELHKMFDKVLNTSLEIILLNF